MEKLWFKAKHYGYGWYPATKEGWAVTLVYVVLLLAPMSLVERFENDPDAALFAAAFFIYAVVLTVTLLVICVKTGEKPGWRWGD